MNAVTNAVALAVLSFTAVWGCGPEFSSCEARRNCPTGKNGGAGGAGGTQAGEGEAGAPNSEGGAGGTAGPANQGGAGDAGSGGSADLGEGGTDAAGAVGTAMGGSDAGASGGGEGGEGGSKSDPCENLVCENDGSCRSDQGTAKCECPVDFTGARCELARFEWIPRLEGDSLSYANAVSADGAIAVGSSAASNYRAYRWEKGVVRDLGQLAGYSLTVAIGLSANGSIVIGDGTSANATRALRWEAGVLKALPPLLGETSSSAKAISADGTSIVGLSGTRTVLWRGGLSEDLGAIGTPTGISGDGSVVVGTNARGPFRWEDGTSMDLTIPSAANTTCSAGAISGDALVIVGSCDTDDETRSYAWTKSGLKDLGLPPLGASPPAVVITSTNRNGTAAVGFASTQDGDRAVVWDSKHGMRWVSSLLSEAGVDLGLQQLRYATGVSDDGKTVVGWGYPLVGDFQGWIARLP